MRAAAACALAVLAAGGCGDDPLPADQSFLDAPQKWQSSGEEHALTLPSDALSLTVWASGGQVARVSLGVREPGGRVLVDPQRPEESLNRVLSGRGQVTAMIPDATAALPLPAELLVTTTGAAPLDVQAWIKRGPMPAVQVLPIALITVGAVADQRNLDLALGVAGSIWHGAGVELGEATRISADDVEGLARVDVDPALAGDSPLVGRALALSARAPAGSLALVVVGDVVLAGESYPIWALAGGIPVPPVNGTTHSGVVVSAALVQRDPFWAGQVIAHEIGHALGLFHTTEATLGADGQPVIDQLDDTASCPASADNAPADGTLGVRECAPYDAGNLMFWSVTRGASAISAEQAAIARRSALTR